MLKRNYVVLMKIGNQHWLPLTAQMLRRTGNVPKQRKPA